MDFIKNIAKRLIGSLRAFMSPFSARYPAGHYYSPIPSKNDVRRIKQRDLRPCESHLLGINISIKSQQLMLDKLTQYYAEIPFTEKMSTTRYYYDNTFFRYGDAITLFLMIRHYKPNKIIEVGSGFSSAAMLDTNELFMDNSIKLTFIEPYPDRLLNLLTEKDKKIATLLEKPVQEVDIDVFSHLAENDILFIDSSHVVKGGSDVTHLLFNILPTLNKGVLIHFHDIFWPFEYPIEWYEIGRAWNEAHFLHAFLMHNNDYELLVFNSYIGKYLRVDAENSMPNFFKDSGGSLWLKKIT